MTLSEILEKREEYILKSIKIYCNLNENLFGNVNAKKLLKFIERLYQKNDKRIL